MVQLKHKDLLHKTKRLWLGVVWHACNPSTQEAEAGGLQIQG
jgi:hypothetical protein